MSVKCPKCQFENTSDSKFCKECGTQIPSSKDIQITETMETPKEELTTGSTFAGRYQIIEELGKGGMGRVYRVLDKELKEEVALKLIKPEIAKDQKTIERFKNELRIARKISHRNVGRMYELMEEGGTHFISMEYVPGQDLRGLIRQTGQLTIGKAIAIAKEICEGLGEAHHQGVIHRDLKPSNIIIDKNGNARILDFGIARSVEGKGITDAGMMIGTPEYMSPEQVEGKEIDQRSDVYSLGIILYEMVTGRVPFEGDTPFTVGVKHKSETPQNPKEINTQIPDDLNSVILRCLEKDKSKRYQSADEVRSELENIEKGIPRTDREMPKRKPITSKEITVTFGFKKLFYPALVLISLAIIIVVIWQILPQKEPVFSPSEKPSIAVLPFEDLSQQKDQGYLCNGFSESIINALYKVQNLYVPALTSSSSFLGKEQDLQEIGEKLNVKTVLRGSVQKVENMIRITAQLINVDDRSVLWSEQYSKELDDIFGIQDDITMAIVNGLQIELLGGEKASIAKRYTDNFEAYELYLKGRSLWNKRTAEDMRESIRYYEAAIEKEPNFALSYAGLADSYITLGDWIVLPQNEAYPKAIAAAKKALEIDDSIAQAYCSLAYLTFIYNWNWEEAERTFKKALELNPNYATAHQWYAEFLASMGRFEEARKESIKAMELDPLSKIISSIDGFIEFFARDHSSGITKCKKVLEIDPTYLPARLYLGWNYEQAGMHENAIEELNYVIDISCGNIMAIAALGRAYASSGRNDEARELLDDLLYRSNQNFVPSYFIAVLYTALDEKDKAFEWLDKAFEERDYWLSYFKVHPWVDKLRRDARFENLLQRIGLEK
jgi:serine/threonine protein kinase/Flp pilus assembly protein TadD